MQKPAMIVPGSMPSIIKVASVQLIYFRLKTLIATKATLNNIIKQ
ncbi:hypothetical protein UFOVP1478_14 [uncultured Caudovirales phage]|jgi:hypothetical protein|uniref:Uncharacterized protein n=1 Tax=uncultured Caudovirales phage TaxID=2100421 RepID=A0A6J5SKP5_9CAUD|nr:hypothetical protein UFOVP1112_7 [uncultured Caudovirales phage]CAB4204049.1 hypothetical protein UFOVP1385_28 [uncultured Caudovirales phage]CAB4215303.1 hypothetical protein UFOVP1478_14 [uncultured Caudovirales phage]